MQLATETNNGSNDANNNNTKQKHNRVIIDESA